MYAVTIAAGQDNVVVGGKGPFTAGDVVLLTDEEYAMIRPGAFATLFEGDPAGVNTTTGTGYPTP